MPRIFAICIATMSLVACHGTALTPATVELPPTGVGWARKVTVDLKLGDRPVPKTAISVRATDAGISADRWIVRDAPEGGIELEFTPATSGPKALTLEVNFAGARRTLQVTSSGVAPDCVSRCLRGPWDLDGNCVQSFTPELGACGQNDCAIVAQCEKGACATHVIQDEQCSAEPVAVRIAPLWRVPVEYAVRTPVADLSGNAYVVTQTISGKNKLTALGVDGSTRWETTTPVTRNEASSSLLLSIESIVIVMDAFQRLHAFDAATGASAWDVDLSVDAMSITSLPIALGGGKFLLQVKGRDDHAKLVVFDASTGSHVTQPAQVLSGEYVTLGDGQGKVFGIKVLESPAGRSTEAFGLDVATGAQWVSIPRGNPVAVSGGNLFLDNGTILDVSDGHAVATVHLPLATGVNSPAVTVEQAATFAYRTGPDGCGLSQLVSFGPAGGAPKIRCVAHAGMPQLVVLGFDVPPTVVPMALTSSGATVLLGWKDKVGAVVDIVSPDGAQNAFILDGETRPSSLINLQAGVLTVLFGDSVRAYRIGTDSLAEHGWVMPGGSPGGGRVPR